MSNSSTRETILQTLETHGTCTVKQLAEAAEVSPVSVRHHLSNLLAEDLIEVEEVKHGVGRPYHQYSLTEKAYELSPGRYFRFTNRLLEEMKDSMPKALVRELMRGMANRLGEDYAKQLQGLPLPQRVERLVELLSEEGFDAEYETKEGEILIHELNCPYLLIGREHPEVCLVDERFIATAMELPVQQVDCRLEGDHHCTYAIQLQDQIKTMEHVNYE